MSIVGTSEDLKWQHDHDIEDVDTTARLWDPGAPHAVAEGCRCLGKCSAYGERFLLLALDCPMHAVSVETRRGGLGLCEVCHRETEAGVVRCPPCERHEGRVA